MKQPRPTTLVFAVAASLVVAVSVLLTLRRGDAATRTEPARFSGSRIVQQMPSLLAAAKLPAPLVVDILRDDAAAAFYTGAGVLDSVIADWRGAAAAVGATARVVNAASAREDRAARVLVIPSSPCLTVEAYEAIDAVTSRGGGVVITGLTGIHDAGCRPIGYGLIVGATGASRADTLESRPMAYVTLQADNPLTIDIPPGSRIDLNPGRQVALRLPRRDAFYSDYALQPEPAGGAPLLDVAITHASRGRGRVVYWGFELRDVVRLPWDRALATLLARNSIAWAASLPMAAVEPWPKGRVAAAAIAQDVEAGFENAQHALDSLRAARVRSTFFLTSDIARRFDGLSHDLANEGGEIGSHTENHRLLGGLPASSQRDRLATAQHDLTKLLGLPVDGLRPPQEQFDVATMKAWLAVGGRYLFGANDSRSASPELLPVGRDTLVLIGRVGSDDFGAAAAAHNDPSATAGIFLDEYGRLRALGGLYALSYHSQLLATPALVPALAHVARSIAADTAVWLATTGEIAEWWRDRAQLEARVTQRAHGFDVTVRNRGERLVGSAVVRVDLRAAGLIGTATTALLPPRSATARLLLPPIPGKSTRVVSVDYAGVKRAASTPAARSRTATAKKKKRFWWLPW